MSLYNGPPRPGARGGRDQFNWESVKSDKDREFYLGHSVKASVGRWQKGKDILWYTREKQGDEAAAVQSELATVKAREEALMLEALGLKPKAQKQLPQPQLDQREMKQLLEGGPEEEEAPEDAAAEADRIKGLGFRAGQIIGAGDAEREVLAGVGMAQPPGPHPRGGPVGEPPGGVRPPPPPSLSAKELKAVRKAQRKEEKKAEKKAKKQARKEARAAKRAKKAARREAEAADGRSPGKRARHDSPSDADSSSSDDSEPRPPPEKRPRGNPSGDPTDAETRRASDRPDRDERLAAADSRREVSPRRRPRDRSPPRREKSPARRERSPARRERSPPR